MAASGIMSLHPRRIVGAQAAIIISPYAKRGHVDHTQYDTTSILRFLIHRFNLPTLPGLEARDAALKANQSKPMGDLTRALNLSPR